ncbi:HD-domain/PDEase-like protein [Gonapodya prolifera JEL478]|uniref:Phosphodiesterase n=1 Tax=Gonapodya prolifera (strain JEL478) TaxID=1344416 RepID=A0A139AUZ2_GONPJ|nr:HD-domain/PDEase-like protein [Gonapodya prolifera JEL478]|eukprot:KXS20315.1 HD-domain/PDEase-like protein [Gonapodya prolifera JEL478]
MATVYSPNSPFTSFKKFAIANSTTISFPPPTSLPPPPYPSNISAILRAGQVIQVVPIYDVDVHWTEETTFIISLTLLAVLLFSLQRFIGEYAKNLVERQSHMQKLALLNTDLKNQLRQINQEVDLDLDAPIYKVIQVIKTIQAQNEVDADMAESLDYAIQILSSNQLFSPDLNLTKGAVDVEVSKWLNSMLTKAAPETVQTQQPVVSKEVAVVAEDKTKSAALPQVDQRVQDALKDVESWDFDVFLLSQLTEGRPLYFTAITIFEKRGIRQHFGIPENVLRKFLTTIETGYKQNPYHNSAHAADVMQTMNYFLHVLGVSAVVTPEDCLAGLIGAIIHDFDHPGVNNAFLINTSAPLALRYNDQGVLENYHCSRAFELMLGDPSINVLASLSPEKFKQVRAGIVSMVLATDMAGHFEYIAKFKNKMTGVGWDFSNPQTGPKDKQLVLDVAMKCSDISNPTKNNSLCTKWTEKIMEEFFFQGDEERKRGVPVSMFMDRATTQIPKCQIGFIDFIVSPLYEVWDAFVDGRTEEEIEFAAIENLKSNREYWKRLQDEQQQPSPPQPPTQQISTTSVQSSAAAGGGTASTNVSATQVASSQTPSAQNASSGGVQGTAAAPSAPKS